MFTITQQINVRPPERHTCRSLQRLSQEQFILFSILMPLGQATPIKARSCAKVHVLSAPTSRFSVPLSQMLLRRLQEEGRAGIPLRRYGLQRLVSSFEMQQQAETTV